MITLAFLTAAVALQASVGPPAPTRTTKAGVGHDLAKIIRARPPQTAFWVGPLPGNGGRNVVVYLPAGVARVGTEVELVFHFHGTYSEHIQRKAADVPKKKWVGGKRLAQTMDAIDELQSTLPHRIALVYPLSAGKRAPASHRGWWNAAYDSMWMTPNADTSEGFDQLHSDASTVIIEQFGVKRHRLRATAIAEGHSAGGLALHNIAWSGTSRVSEFLFLDAAFSGWGQGCHDGIVAHHSNAQLTIVVTEGGIADPFKGRTPWCADAKAEDGPWWSEVEPWCEALGNDMRDIEGVSVHRTKVPHGQHPRKFAGGLGLRTK